MKVLGLRIIKNSQFRELKAAADTALTLAPSEVAKAVQALWQSETGAAVSADIEAISSKNLTAADKFEGVLANTLPLVLGLLNKNGLSAALEEIEDIGHQPVQAVFNDFKSAMTGALQR